MSFCFGWNGTGGSFYLSQSARSLTLQVEGVELRFEGVRSKLERAISFRSGFMRRFILQAEAKPPLGVFV